jgi:hypothetical protein
VAADLRLSSRRRAMSDRLYVAKNITTVAHYRLTVVVLAPSAAATRVFYNSNKKETLL